MQYCYQDPEFGIRPPAGLPESFANVSNFHTQSVEELAGYGWYPFVATTPPLYNLLTERVVATYSLNAGKVVDSWQVVPLTTAEQVEIVRQVSVELGQAVKAHLNATVLARDYDSIVSACTYATSSVPSYQADGQACVNWRDAVWPAVYTILAEVQAGNRAIPTAEELIAELPELVWP
jgi:hypothetical protein